LVTYDPRWRCLEAAFRRFDAESPHLREVVSLRRRERIEDVLRGSYRPRLLSGLVHRLWGALPGDDRAERLESAWALARVVVDTALSFASDYLAFLEEDPHRTKDERERKLATLWRGIAADFKGDRERFDEAVRMFLRFTRLWNYP
jgi:hypothetical protein